MLASNRKTLLPFFKADNKSARFNIPVTPKSRQLLKAAKLAIEEGDLRLSLDILSKIDSPFLNTELLDLKSRLSEYTQNRRNGILTSEQESVGYNRLSRDLIALISKLEKEFESDESNYAEIRKYLIEKRYKPRIHQKLAGDQLFNLNVQYTYEGTSPEKAGTFITLQGKKSGAEIRQIFEQASRRLLVTGLPGAGKTSLLLNLALELLETDREKFAVLLNLATWRSDFQTLDDWLREILPAELGVTKRYAAEILRKNQLTLLLDGLDEVDEAHRASCLKAIGEYGRLGRDYVISTRKDEYKALEKDAPVWAQIEVLPLTDKQLLAQLDSSDRRDFPEAPDLKAALEHDPLLLKVAETPFYLNCLQLLFRGGSTLSEMNFKGETLEVRQTEIIEHYTEQALAMQSPQGYKPEQVRCWLSFFASRLSQRNKVVFELVDLQYDWWRWGRVEFFLGRLIQCPVLYMPTWGVGLLLYIPVFNKEIDETGDIPIVLFWTLIGFFIISFLVSFSFPIWIYTKDGMRWTWEKYFQRLRKNYLKLICVIVVILVGLWNFALLFTFTFFILLALLLLYAKDILYDTSISLLQITTPYQRFTASAKALHFSIFQHWLLRWQLYRAGVLPLRLVDFLNEMTERHLLETDGATWRFRHRILQEYFAGQWRK